VLAGPAPRAGPRRTRFWRGAAGTVALAWWSLAGVVTAAVALLPVALEDGPRGRARAVRDAAAPRLGAARAAPETLPAARAAREAFPG
jgi:hypothetical protein